MEAANDPDVTLTGPERDVVRHALGLTMARIAYRNYYLTGSDGDDFNLWTGLVQRGLAVTWKTRFCDEVYFAATMPAAKAVKNKSEGFNREITAELMRIEQTRRKE